MVLVDSCCRFISLSVGSLAIGIFIVVSSVLGIVYIVDLSDNQYWSFEKITLNEAMYGGIITSTILILIGIVIIGGWIWKKYKIIKWASIALLVVSILRIIISIWRLAVGMPASSFILVLVVILFYLYGVVVLWSFYQEERDIEIARTLPDYHNLVLSTFNQPATENPGVSSTKKWLT